MLRSPHHNAIHIEKSFDIKPDDGQWRTQEIFFGEGSTNSVEDREEGDLGSVAP